MPTWGRGTRCAPSAPTGRSAVRFGILPQVLPNFLSYVLLRFEINVRGATVIGFVGAGGIGQELYSVISFNYYQEIGAIIVLIILTVSLIDLTSERLRMRPSDVRSDAAAPHSREAGGTGRPLSRHA